MDIQILPQRRQGKLLIEAKTPKATIWLHSFAWMNNDNATSITIEVDEEAREEYLSAARAAGLEIA